MKKSYDFNSPKLFPKFCDCSFPAVTGPRGLRRCARCALIESDMSKYHPQDRKKPLLQPHQLQEMSWK